VLGSTHKGVAQFPNNAKYLIQNSKPLDSERFSMSCTAPATPILSGPPPTQFYFEDYFVASKMRELSKGFVLTPHSNLDDKLIDVIFTNDGMRNLLWTGSFILFYSYS
jgi:hypothetical protein